MREKIVGTKYFLTINSNLTDTPANKSKLQGFVKGVKRLLLSNNLLNMIRILSPKDEKIPKKQLIQEINTDASIEVGQKVHRVHLHATIMIWHRTTLSLSGIRIHEYLLKQTGLSCGVNIRVRDLAKGEVSTKRYLQKGKPQPKYFLQANLSGLKGKSNHFDSRS